MTNHHISAAPAPEGGAVKTACVDFQEAIDDFEAEVADVMAEGSERADLWDREIMVNIDALKTVMIAALATREEAPAEAGGFSDEIEWLREAARYFSARDTKGEDRAHWANVYNAENARKLADRLAEPSSNPCQLAVATSSEASPCPFCGGEAEKFSMADRVGIRCADVMCAGSHRLPSAGEDAAAAWNRRAALASSGDHAELIGRLRKVESGQDDGFLPGAACTNWYRNPDGPAAADALDALIAENAALREDRDQWRIWYRKASAEINAQDDRATEAERKLAEAVGLLRDLASWFDGSAYNGAWVIRSGDLGVDDAICAARTFLSKEAERG